jgi:trk system potassium uptake protein TrkA
LDRSRKVGYNAYIFSPFCGLTLSCGPMGGMPVEKKQFAVIGLGRFGKSVGQTLCNMGYDALGVDRNGERVQEMVEVLTHAVEADVTEENVLRSLGIRNFDVVVVAIGKDLQASILVTLLLKELGVGYVLAKAQDPLHGKVLHKVGADRVIYPERDMGIRVARHLVAANIVDYIDLAPNYSIVEITAPKEFVGKNLRQLELRSRYRVNVLALKRGKKIHISPGAQDFLERGDILVVMGENDDIRRLEQQ